MDRPNGSWITPSVSYVEPKRLACALCGRPFTDLVSKTIGLGPVCAKQIGVPHSSEAASTIIARRQAFLQTLDGEEVRS